MERRWYQETWAIIALLLFFFPVGLYLMWRHAVWDRRTKWVVTGILAVLIVVVAVSGAVGDDDVGDDSRTVVGGAATEPPPTEPPTGSSTEVPTEIPTKEPTEPPSQGPPALTASECAYINSIGEQSFDLADALGQLGDLMGDPRFFSDDWILSVSLQLAILRITYDEASAFNPPTSLRPIHQTYLGALSKYNDATFLIAEGIDNIDASRIDEASRLMVEATGDIGRAATLVDDFDRTHSGSCQ